ncbi:MAG: 60S ribosomal export protein NMD3, partial [Euryarchaeota archaeon]|nr:60S ribosomal export protein NMD3 [Euryarchaeota archaeon]
TQTDELFDSLCEDCFKREIKLIEPTGISVSICRTCGCYFKGNERTSIEAVVEATIRKEIWKKYGCDSEVEIKEIKTGDKRAHVVLIVKAELRGLQLTENGELEVVLKRESCERCNRISGGYYAGIVQIRADDRIPTDDELAIAEKVARSSLIEPDFISKEVLLKEGLDIYVSSMDCGRRISNAIVRRFGGSYSKSQKLYGRKDGRNVYRISFSVRMPGFRVGDVLEIGDKRISIEKMVEGRGIEGVDIDTDEHVFLSKRETMKAKRV